MTPKSKVTQSLRGQNDLIISIGMAPLLQVDGGLRTLIISIGMAPLLQVDGGKKTPPFTTNNGTIATSRWRPK